MAIASLLEVRMADGSEPPTGSAARLLADFDLSAAMHGARGRRRLLGVLTEDLDRVASDAELDLVLSSLRESNFIVDRGEHVAEYLEPPDLGPEFRAKALRPRIRRPDEPEVGEQCYSATLIGLRAARLCAGLRNRQTRPPWLLGGDRVEDQILLSIGGSVASTLQVTLDCCNTPEEQISPAIAKLVASGLLETVGDDETPRYRASLAGTVRQRTLLNDVIAVLMRLALPPNGSEGAIPPALRIQPERKLGLLKSLNEEQLCRRVIIPLLEAMGYLDVSYNNGPQERGKDIFCWKTDELGERESLAIMAKAGDVTGAASGGNSSAITIANQMRQLFFDPVVAPPAVRGVLMDRCWVVISGRFVGDALSKVENELRLIPLTRSARWIDGQRLVRLLDHRLPAVWATLLEATSEREA